MLFPWAWNGLETHMSRGKYEAFPLKKKIQFSALRCLFLSWSMVSSSFLFQSPLFGCLHTGLHLDVRTMTISDADGNRNGNGNHESIHDTQNWKILFKSPFVTSHHQRCRRSKCCIGVASRKQSGPVPTFS